MADERAGEPAGLPWRAMLPWQRDAALAALAQRASWPHALLVHGPRGIGKHALALNFAQALLCETPEPDGMPCGRCPGCHYVVAGQHPDLMRLELLEIDPVDGTLIATETIGVERVRAVTDFVQLSSHRHRAKVAVIAPADRMNAAAANALLKTLEEPPPGTYLILVADQPGRLPPTIVSRCRMLPAPFPAPAIAHAWLTAQGIARPDLVLAQVGGAPLAAAARAEPAVQSERRAWLDALARPESFSAQGLAARIDAGGRDERKRRLGYALEWLIAWTADLARIAAGGEPRQNPDAAGALVRLAPRVARVPLFRYHRLLLRHRAMLAHPLHPRLVAEALLIDYRALF